MVTFLLSPPHGYLHRFLGLLGKQSRELGVIFYRSVANANYLIAIHKLGIVARDLPSWRLDELCSPYCCIVIVEWISDERQRQSRRESNRCQSARALIWLESDIDDLAVRGAADLAFDPFLQITQRHTASDLQERRIDPIADLYDFVARPNVGMKRR